MRNLVKKSLISFKNYATGLIIILIIFGAVSIINFLNVYDIISHLLIYDKLRNIRIPNNNIYNISQVLDSDLDSFHSYIKDVYFYDEEHDCKYWTAVWLYYVNKHGYRHRIIITDNHVFLVFWTEDNSEYCLADQTNLNCYNLVTDVSRNKPDLNLDVNIDPNIVQELNNYNIEIMQTIMKNPNVQE